MAVVLINGMCLRAPPALAKAGIRMLSGCCPDAVADGVDQPLDVVVVESGEGAAKIHGDSGGDARGEAQDPAFAAGAG